MRRLLLIAVLLAALAATTAGVAWARGGDAGGQAAAARDPLRVPAAAPRVDPDQAGVVSYRPVAEIAAAMAPARDAAARPADEAVGSASVTVTAVVLPTITLQLARDGSLASIVANTPERDATAVVYAVRSASGAHRPVTPALWASARVALAGATAGIGTIWSR